MTVTKSSNTVLTMPGSQRFVVVMLCAPGQQMLVYVDDEELERRRDRRVGRVS